MTKSFLYTAAILSLATGVSLARETAAIDQRGATLLWQHSNPQPVAAPAPAPAQVPATLPPLQEPKVINPGPPPADAIVLFDGTDLSQWANDKGGPAKWNVQDGVITVAPRTGYIHTRQAFGDCQLHIEWATPAEVKGDGQGRGNSGIFLQSRYEIQVLDSYHNKTYFDGQAGSVYKQYPPLVNACRKPGEWQTYDIIYHAPRFDAAGKLTRAGTVTVIQNGVLVQDHVEILGNTMEATPKYHPHGEREPLALQDHGNPVRYRNIWLREL